MAQEQEHMEGAWCKELNKHRKTGQSYPDEWKGLDNTNKYSLLLDAGQRHLPSLLRFNHYCWCRERESWLKQGKEETPKNTKQKQTKQASWRNMHLRNCPDWKDLAFLSFPRCLNLWHSSTLEIHHAITQGHQHGRKSNNAARARK